MIKIVYPTKKEKYLLNVAMTILIKKKLNQ